jgi:hypothetical protein
VLPDSTRGFWQQGTAAATPLSHNRIELFVPLTADVDRLPSGVTGLTPAFGSAPKPAMNSKHLATS